MLLALLLGGPASSAPHAVVAHATALALGVLHEPTGKFGFALASVYVALVCLCAALSLCDKRRAAFVPLVEVCEGDGAYHYASFAALGAALLSPCFRKLPPIDAYGAALLCRFALGAWSLFSEQPAVFLPAVVWAIASTVAGLRLFSPKWQPYLRLASLSLDIFAFAGCSWIVERTWRVPSVQMDRLSPLLATTLPVIAALSSSNILGVPDSHRDNTLSQALALLARTVVPVLLSARGEGTARVLQDSFLALASSALTLLGSDDATSAVAALSVSGASFAGHAVMLLFHSNVPAHRHTDVPARALAAAVDAASGVFWYATAQFTFQTGTAHSKAN